MTPDTADANKPAPVITWDAEILGSDTARETNEERRRFFDRSREHTPVLAVEDDEGGIVLVGTDDRTRGRMLFSKRQHGSVRTVRRAEQVLRRFGPRVASGPRTFVDLGAEVGATTVGVMRSLAFEHGLAVEPHPSRFRLLRANLTLNDLDRVVALHGLPTSDGPGGYRRSKGRREWRLVERDGLESAMAKGRAVEVPGLTLDHLMAAEHLTPESQGIVWAGGGIDVAELLTHAGTAPADRLPAIVEFDATRTADEAAYAAFLGAVAGRYASVVDLSLNPRDVTAVPSDALRSVTERYAQASKSRSTHLLLFGRV